MTKNRKLIEDPIVDDVPGGDPCPDIPLPPPPETASDKKPRPLVSPAPVAPAVPAAPAAPAPVVAEETPQPPSLPAEDNAPQPDETGVGSEENAGGEKPKTGPKYFNDIDEVIEAMEMISSDSAAVLRTLKKMKTSLKTTTREKELEAELARIKKVLRDL
jgi:hypothetical protein